MDKMRKTILIATAAADEKVGTLKATHFTTVGDVYKSKNGYYLFWKSGERKYRVPGHTNNDCKSKKDLLRAFDWELNNID
jgi:uncharacterized beta-barrel protein YwiB (DUF1934 family)